MQNKKDSITKIVLDFLSLALFFLLYGMLVAMIIRLAINSDPNSNEAFGVLFSLLCGTPFVIWLFVSLKFIKRSNWPIAFGLPILVVPLLIFLFLTWLAIQERPTNIFKDFVADPIPVGVSNIQGRNATEGFDELRIIIAFNATPKVIDQIIADQGLVQVQAQDASDMDDGFQKFQNVDLHQNWTVYEENFSKSEYSWGPITMWVNSKRDFVLFQYFDY
jgi:hypothetical protein